ncbi:hypothetical protein [Methanimicrococcus hongohii]|nr:hypothetical protein [Methanimicrococcus sp. Hf6]
MPLLPAVCTVVAAANRHRPTLATVSPSREPLRFSKKYSKSDIVFY